MKQKLLQEEKKSWKKKFTSVWKSYRFVEREETRENLFGLSLLSEINLNESITGSGFISPEMCCE